MTSEDNPSESRSTSDSDSDSTDNQPTNERYSDSQRLGVYEGWPVHIAVSQEPATAQVPQHFGVNLFVVNEDGENIDIARIDTEHRGCHIDRFYLPEDHPERLEDYSVQYQTPDEAFAHFVIEGEWRYYVQRYKETHGLPEAARVYG